MPPLHTVSGEYSVFTLLLLLVFLVILSLLSFSSLLIVVSFISTSIDVLGCTCIAALSSLAFSSWALAAWPIASAFPCSAANCRACASAAPFRTSVIFSAILPTVSSLLASFPFLGTISVPLCDSTTTKSDHSGCGIFFQAFSSSGGCEVHSVVFHMGVALKFSRV